MLNPHGGVEKAYLKQEFASISRRWYYWYRWLRRYLSARHYLELWIQRRLYTGGRVKRVIAISSMVKRDIVAYFGFPEEKIAVVFNTVDLDRFHPSIRDQYRHAKRKELGIDENTSCPSLRRQQLPPQGTGTATTRSCPAEEKVTGRSAAFDRARTGSDMALPAEGAESSV